MSEHPAVVFLRQAHERAEELARAAGGEQWMTGVDIAVVTRDEQPVVYDEGEPTWDQAQHIALHDPAAVLRRVAAERQIFAGHQSTTGLGYAGADYVELDCACTCCGTADEYGTPWPCRTVLLLAEAWGWTEETP